MTYESGRLDTSGDEDKVTDRCGHHHESLLDAFFCLKDRVSDEDLTEEGGVVVDGAGGLPAMTDIIYSALSHYRRTGKRPTQ